MVLAVDIAHRFASFALEVKFQSQGRLNALFGRSCAG